MDGTTSPLRARHSLVTDLKVGFFLGVRQLRRANRWATALIIFIMTLTFLNMVVVSGILVGLIEGGNKANRDQFTGDVFISKLSEESLIQNTGRLVHMLDSMPQVADYSVRYSVGATAEANYRTRRDFNALPNSVPASLVGIDVANEESVTGISNLVIEGAFLDPRESGYVVLGSTLLDRYSAFADQFEPLRDVQIGDKIKLSITGTDPVTLQTVQTDAVLQKRVQEFIVKGIVDSKVGEVSFRFFVTDNDFRRLAGRTILNANEIAIRTAPGVTDDQLKQILLANGFDRYATVETAAESIPSFLNDIKLTFGLLGNVIGSIGIIVASITIFIVVFINALTRQKYIGILKAIGVTPRSIKYAYILQSVFYATIGSCIATIIIYAVLVPLLLAHPLDFPFSDGILVAPFGGTLTRFLFLMAFTILAGLIPASMIIRRNTLASILGR